MKPFKARVAGRRVPRVGWRWLGGLTVEHEGRNLHLLMTGSIARWFPLGELVEVELREEPEDIGGVMVAPRESYRLWRVYRGEEKVLVWPVWSRVVSVEREAVLGRSVYSYRLLAREAYTEDDYKEIVGLEQYHYASKEEIVAIWKCPVCGAYVESNIQPECPTDRVPMKLQEIRGSLPSSRFMVIELLDRKPYEPKIVGYVRVDTPIPLMHRRVPRPDGGFEVEKMIREKVFPKDWFHPTFWPVDHRDRRSLLARFRELARLYGSRRIARAAVGEEIADEALARANTAAARIARVVVHPDYRGDGLGVASVRLALEWIRERRIPEMKRAKHVVETIAQMARYNPFFERAGFKYMWDTASGRPVLMYPLSDRAKRIIEEFLSSDPVARSHGGVLYRPRYKAGEKLSGPVSLSGVTKSYRSTLDIERLPEELQEVLRAFGAERRVVERYVLKDVNITVNPSTVAAVVGASGAGKTTLLRMILGKALGIESDNYSPDRGEVAVPSNVKAAALLPGEIEPSFGSETLLEHVASKLGDPGAAVEVLSSVGLGDAIFFRASFRELSTGQKERAKLASLLAERPNLLVIDEFMAHLDPLTARRIARKLGRLARGQGITLIVSTNRPEILDALQPDTVILVGYGSAFQEKPEKVLREV
ncbi:GNAT family N-acetyltransferase [Aeropyrum camini]